MLDQLNGSEKVDAARQAEAFKTRNLQARVLMFGKETISEWDTSHGELLGLSQSAGAH